MTDDWLKEISNKKILGAVLLDFIAAFEIIDHNFLSRKRTVPKVWTHLLIEGFFVICSFFYIVE